jgi:uncharacterized membrane protein
MREEPTEGAGSARISRARLTWLQSESTRWVADGLVDPVARTRILSRYQIESAEHRSMLALMVLGALMFAIGVLLLIGYNWSAIPAAGKIAILMGSVAAAFAGSAAALARRHHVAGDVLALIGVLLFGNAIWLIAQVLHIQGDFPDGFFWWAIGGVATAALLESWIVGISGAALVTSWIVAAVISFSSRSAGDQPFVTFVLVWTTTLALAYRVTSPTMIKILAVGAAVWIVFWRAGSSAEQVAPGVAAIAACLFYSFGRWHRPDNAMGRAWQSAGLSILLVAFVPLLITELHDEAPGHVTWGAIVPALVLAAGALASVAWTRGRQAYLADYVIAGTAVVVAAWLILLARGLAGADAWATIMTIGFSILALFIAVSLIRKALRTDRISDLTFGVAFALAFLLVRWASLIDSMLWSGLMLLAASGGFFVIARLWRHRPRRPASVDVAVGGAL